MKPSPCARSDVRGGIELDFVAHRPTPAVCRPAGQPLSRTGPTAPGRHGRWYSSPDHGSRVVKGGIKHLVMDQFDIADAFAFDKAVEMFFDDKSSPSPPAVDTAKPVCPLSASTSTQSASQHVDAKRLPGLLILFIFAHRGGDMIVQSVVSPGHGNRHAGSALLWRRR